MGKENFRHGETQQLIKHLEEAARRSGMSRGATFEDALTMIRCALGRPLMEEEYMATVARHAKGPQGKRGADSIANLFGNLALIMEQTHNDVLGDLYEGAITYGEAGQFLTPPELCQLTARMNLPAEPTDIDGRKTVADPCCGSGRMLLAAAEVQPNWHFIGQDVDFRCVQMTAINLALRNRYGHVIWGNSLAAGDTRRVFETGRVQICGNGIREVRLESCPPPVRQVASQPMPHVISDQPATQLSLFD